ncbi:TolC family protein [Roseobacteraceae bacterium S113]
MKTRALILAIGISAFLSGCTVGPNYQPPSKSIPARFVAGQGSSLVSPETQLWWRDLNDPILDGLIGRALAQNLDIRSSLARLEQAEAQFRGTGINEQISGSLSSSSTENGGDNLETTRTETTTLTGSFVIDLFGGVKRGREQALANLEASGFNVGDARAAVTLAVVSNYVSARFSQEAAQLTRNTISSRRQTLSLVRDERELGSSSELDVAQAETDLFAAQADLEGYISDFEGSVFALATLLDTAPFPCSETSRKGQDSLPHLLLETLEYPPIFCGTYLPSVQPSVVMRLPLQRSACKRQVCTHHCSFQGL